jgi:hypothetical protein
LSQESEWLDGLTLEGEPPVRAPVPDPNDPYNRG